MEARARMRRRAERCVHLGRGGGGGALPGQEGGREEQAQLIVQFLELLERPLDVRCLMSVLSHHLHHVYLQRPKLRVHLPPRGGGEQMRTCACVSVWAWCCPEGQSSQKSLQWRDSSGGWAAYRQEPESRDLCLCLPGHVVHRLTNQLGCLNLCRSLNGRNWSVWDYSQCKSLGKLQGPLRRCEGRVNPKKMGEQEATERQRGEHSHSPCWGGRPSHVGREKHH